MANYTLSVDFKANTSNLTSGVDNVQSKMRSISSTFDNIGQKIKNFGDKMNQVGSKISGLGTKLTLGLTTPIVLAGKSMFSAASDFDENLNKVNVAFGKSAKEVTKWAETATDKFGLSKNAAYEATSLFGDMATSMGISQKKAASMSTTLAGLAGDLSSFKNISIDEAMTALNGVFTGETESLKRLGIVMTEVNLEEFAKKIGKTYKEMSQAEKVQLRYNYVLEKSKNAIGDYSRTSDGAANGTRTLFAAIDNLKIVLGQELLPIFTPIILKIADLVKKFTDMDDKTRKNILIIGGLIAVGGPLLIFLGKLVSSINTVIKGIGGIISVVKGVGKAFMFFTSPAGLMILLIGAIIVAGMFLMQHWEEIKTVILDVVEKIKVKFEEFKTSVVETWNNITTKFNEFKDFLNNVFATDWSEKFGFFGEILNLFLHTIQSIFNSIKRIFTGIINFIAGIFTADWERAWQGVVDIFGGIFDTLGSILKAPLNAVISLINGAINGLNKISVSIPNWVPVFGGKTFGVSIPKIPYLLHGTDSFQGGFARMNEGGRGELVNLPNGTQVIPHDISKVYAKESARLNNSGGTVDLDGILDGISIPIYINAEMDGTPLLKRVADYTIRKIGNDYKAVLSNKGV